MWWHSHQEAWLTTRPLNRKRVGQGHIRIYLLVEESCQNGMGLEAHQNGMGKQPNEVGHTHWIGMD